MHFRQVRWLSHVGFSAVFVVTFITCSSVGGAEHASATPLSPLTTTSSDTSVGATSRNSLSSRSSAVCTQGVPAGIAHCDAHINDIISHNVGGGGGVAFTPKFIQSAYDVASTTKAHGGGAHQIVGIVEAFSNPDLASDLAVYREMYRLATCPLGSVSTTLATCTLQIVNEVGGASPLPEVSASWGAEAAIDTDMISAVCPRCQILLVEAQSSSIPDLGAAVNTAVRLGATVVSNSYGSSEYPNENADSELYYDHPGIPIVVAAGDTGFGVQFPAASPDVVAVGGTALIQKTSAGVRNGSESAWSGTASGCSLYEPKPAWQLDTGCTNRSVADISAVADPNTGVWAYDTYQEPGMVVAGGTSVATQIISAMFALEQGTSASVPYPAANLYASPNALYHVSTGGNATCGTYLCDATLSEGGYNGPTGLGSPGNVPNSNAAFLPPSSPLAPTLESALGANGQVTLQWLNNPQISGSSSISYVVLESFGGLAPKPINTSPITGTTYTVQGLTNGTSYVFSVASKNSAGMSHSSNSLSAVPSSFIGEADAPISVRAKAGNTVATISWTAPLVTGASPITSYTASDDLGAYCSHRVQVGGTNFCVVRGLTNGQSYQFTVVATNQSGAGPASEESNTVVPVAPPSRPLEVIATPGDRGAVVTWTTPLHNGATPILRYDVSDRRGQSCVRALSVPIINSCIVGGLRNGSSYAFVVTATNAVGSSPTSLASASVVIEPSTPVAQVSTGVGFACAELLRGTIRCWGDNSFGQLGDSSFKDSSTPVQVKGVTNAAQISIGATFACALVASQVKCWGDNSSGQLGATNSFEATSPLLVPSLGRATSISAGENYACAVTMATTVACWGANSNGQLGNGTITSNSPARTIVGLRGALQVSAGVNHTCALLKSTSVECWGDNTYGQLGNATKTSTTTPVIVASLSGVTQISVDTSSSCALLRGGTVKCWGYNSDGELGTGTTTSSDVALSVVGLSHVVKISSGDFKSCAVLENATVTCWGQNAATLFRRSAPSVSLSPAAIKTLFNVRTMIVNGVLTCSLSLRGAVTCWDTNSPTPRTVWFPQT